MIDAGQDVEEENEDTGDAEQKQKRPVVTLAFFLQKRK